MLGSSLKLNFDLSNNGGPDRQIRIRLTSQCSQQDDYQNPPVLLTMRKR